MYFKMSLHNVSKYLRYIAHSFVSASRYGKCGIPIDVKKLN